MTQTSITLESISHWLWVAPREAVAGKQSPKGLPVKGCLLAAVQKLVVKVLPLGGISKAYCTMDSLFIC